MDYPIAGYPRKLLSIARCRLCLLKRIVKSRTGALIDQHPCRLEISEEDGCAWVGVDPLALSDLRQDLRGCLQGWNLFVCVFT